MKKDLRNLRHAFTMWLEVNCTSKKGLIHTGYCLDREVAETADCPGILVCRDESFSVIRIIQQIQEELRISLDGVYTCL